MKILINLLTGFLLLISAVSCQPEQHQLLADGESHLATPKSGWQNSEKKTGAACLVDGVTLLYGSRLAPALEELEAAPVAVPQATSAIPLVIKRFWRCLTNEDFTMANPGENWQVGDMIVEELPRRQLAYLGVSDHLVVLAYFVGGIGKYENVMVFNFKDQGVAHFWCAQTMTDLTTRQQVLDFIEKGTHGGDIEHL